MVDALDGFEKRVDRNAWKGSKIVQEDRSTESWEVVAKDGKETCFSGAFKKNTIAGVSFGNVGMWTYTALRKSEERHVAVEAEGSYVFFGGVDDLWPS